MTGVSMSGLMTGVRWTGTKNGMTLMKTLLRPSLSLGSVEFKGLGDVGIPKRVEWAKANLDTGEAVNTNLLYFGLDRAGDGRFCRPPSGEGLSSLKTPPVRTQSSLQRR